ncbi:MAG: hypothetical protein IT426_12980 [Pirellulales bacterium]|nr:hypothetical protein [Pirellulales bacterium]
MPDYNAQTYQPPAPVASVVIRTLDNQNSISNVPMLIDSGSDVTLIPELCVRHLSLEAYQQGDYQLMAFDGSKTTARSVQCELLFLRRAYIGVYLLTDDTTGILGRDVLNHLCLVLDGPGLNWREEHTVK